MHKSIPSISAQSSRLLFEGGYVSVSNSAYHFFISDHLGSVRVVANTSGTAEEYDHYYPLGGPIAQYSSSTSLQPLKFQGKEWGADKGLNLYDFGARRYDPATGRWVSQDPLAEKDYFVSPYCFCHSNSLIRIDPNGLVDWKLFRTGVYTTVGGVASTVGGGFLAGASGGIAAGVAAFLISDGVLAIGSGISLMTIGLIDDPQLVENVQGLPTNIPEMGGGIIDSLTDNEAHIWQTIGTSVDFTIGFGVSIKTNFIPRIPSIIGIVVPVASTIDNHVSEKTASNTIESYLDIEEQKQTNLWDPNQELWSF